MLPSTALRGAGCADQHGPAEGLVVGWKEQPGAGLSWHGI